MPTWCIEQQHDGFVTLRYRKAASGSGSEWTVCGQGPQEVCPALLEWVLGEAQAGDLVITPAGSYAMQRGPGGHPACA